MLGSLFWSGRLPAGMSAARDRFSTFALRRRRLRIRSAPNWLSVLLYSQLKIAGAVDTRCLKPALTPGIHRPSPWSIYDQKRTICNLQLDLNLNFFRLKPKNVLLSRLRAVEMCSLLPLDAG